MKRTRITRKIHRYMSLLSMILNHSSNSWNHTGRTCLLHSKRYKTRRIFIKCSSSIKLRKSNGNIMRSTKGKESTQPQHAHAEYQSSTRSPASAASPPTNTTPTKNAKKQPSEINGSSKVTNKKRKKWRWMRGHF